MIVPVTEPEFQKGKSVFERAKVARFVAVADDEISLADYICRHNCKAVVVGVVPYVGPLYDALPVDGLILRFGVGTDSLDHERARSRRIHIANTPGALDEAVAEHTIFLMGALARHLTRCDSALREGQWRPQTGEELWGRKLAVFGLGRIGARVATIAHRGLEMEIAVCEIQSPSAAAARLGFTSAALQARVGYSQWSDSPEEILPNADVISVHLPLTPATYAYFDSSKFRLMKAGSLFINTARGGLVDEVDLYQSLVCGHLAGAALDVYEREPYAPIDANADLRSLPNVVLTPHVASNTFGANRRMAQMTVTNLTQWIAGHRNQVHLVC